MGAVKRGRRGAGGGGPAAAVRGPSKCSLCREPGNNKSSCTNAAARAAAKPETPDPDTVIEAMEVLGVFDLESCQ